MSPILIYLRTPTSYEEHILCMDHLCNEVKKNLDILRAIIPITKGCLKQIQKDIDLLPEDPNQQIGKWHGDEWTDPKNGKVYPSIDFEIGELTSGFYILENFHCGEIYYKKPENAKGIVLLALDTDKF